jgi:hypothetical protein
VILNSKQLLSVIARESWDYMGELFLPTLFFCLSYGTPLLYFFVTIALLKSSTNVFFLSFTIRKLSG